MKPEDLVKVWDAPDHSKLTPKQISIRMPVLAAAKFAALAEMYPSKSKSQMLADLVATAIDQVIEALPSAKGALLSVEPDDQILDNDLRDFVNPEDVRGIPVYEDIGPKGQFLRLLKKHMREIESEAGIKDHLKTPDPVIVGSEE